MMNNMMNNVMNNIEMVSRLKTAAHYQRKAVCALLPEGMESHVDVISNELKLMIKEMVMRLLEIREEKKRLTER